MVEAAEGHELIDVEGRRYLDAISSLWVTTLGHRVPELDEALREQLDRVAHSTLLGNGNRAVVELAEALAPVVPVDRPHFLFASDGAAAVEQALKIAFQYWANQGVDGRTGYLALGGAYHGDTVGSLSRGRRRASAPTCSTRCGSGCCGRRATTSPGRSTPPRDLIDAHAGPSWRRWWSSRWCRGPRACWCADPAALRAAGATACRAPRRAAGVRRGGHRLRPHRHAVRLRAVRPAARPDVHRQGPHRRLPADVGHRGEPAGLRGVPRARPVGADLLPRPLLQRERPGRGGRPPPPRAARRAGRAGQRGRPGRQLRRAARRARRPAARRWRTCACAGSWAASSWRPRPTACDGAGGCAPRPCGGGCCCGRWATSWWSCRYSTVDRRRDRAHRGHAGRGRSPRCAA